MEHSLEDVLPLVDRLIIMHSGEILRDGPTCEILAQGDIPHVFKRPDLLRLADELKLPGQPLSPEDFASSLAKMYGLRKIQITPDRHKNSPARGPVIEIENVSFNYVKDRDALKNVSLTIQAGELVAILGRNGSGKTTLVRHVIGLHQPAQGKVRVLGRDVAQTPTHILAQDVGFCFQNPNHQIVSFNVRDEMTFGLKAHSIDPSEYQSRIHEALEIVDMVNYMDTEVFDLGKGQKQRLALASVLTLKPQILVIDEPTTGQDPEMIDGIFEIIKRLNETGTTILLVTHRIDYAAMFAQRAVVLKQGEVSYDRPILDLLGDLKTMQENSLILPEISKLSLRLKDYGIPTGTVAYSAMKAYLDQIIEAPNGH